MPAGSIHQQNHESLLELVCQVIQEEAHHVGVSAWQKQGAEPPQLRAHRRKYIDKLADDLPWRLGPKGLGSPTAPGAVDAPKAPFVLGYDQHRASVLGLARGQHGGYVLSKVFLNACCCSGFAFG